MLVLGLFPAPAAVCTGTGAAVDDSSRAEEGELLTEFDSSNARPRGELYLNTKMKRKILTVYSLIIYIYIYIYKERENEKV